VIPLPNDILALAEMNTDAQSMQIQRERIGTHRSNAPPNDTNVASVSCGTGICGAHISEDAAYCWDCCSAAVMSPVGGIVGKHVGGGSYMSISGKSS
jgi:hypothetical protein